MSNSNINTVSLKTRLPFNLITNIISFSISIIVGLFLVPYYIDNLGVSSYALVPLCLSITGYMSIVTQSLSCSVSRYLTVDIHSGDLKKANITFNTTIFSMIGLSLFLLPFILIMSYYAPTYFGISSTARWDATLLFFWIMATFLITEIGGMFSVPLFAYNRLDLQNLLNTLNPLLRFGVVVLLFNLYVPNLQNIGISNFIASFIVFVLTIYFSKKISPMLNINYSDFKVLRLKEIMKMGNWVIIDQIGTLLLLSIDLILVNKLFGTTAGGEYATVFTFSRLLRTMASFLATLITPITLTYYAKNQFEKMLSISKIAVKFMSLFMALPIGLICGLAPQILSLWIGPEFTKLTPLVWLLTGSLIFDLSVIPLFSINIAFNKVRIPGIFTLFMGILKLVLAIAIADFTCLGYYGVAAAGILVSIFRNLFFVSWYATRLLNVSKYTFIFSIFYGIITVPIIAGFTFLFNQFFHISTILSIFIYCVIISLVYLSITWIVSLNKVEQNMIRSFIPYPSKAKT